MAFVINGIFFNSRLTGIERYAYEVTSCLDKICKAGQIKLLLSPKADKKNIPQYKNIQTLTFPKTPLKDCHNIKLSLYMFFHKVACLDYTNHMPFFGKNNVAFLHDIYCRVYPQDFVSKRDKKVLRKTLAMYSRICKRARLICTVSEFSKKQIMDYYGVPAEKIKVVYCSAEAFDSVEKDDSILDLYPELKKKSFYFTLGSLSLRKNLKWIADHAELYPDETFVISGGALKNVVPDELKKIQTLKNIILAGYLSDGQVKSLYENCKAFVFPSYFEGFGMPPLEALSCGAPIIISHDASLPEIYGDCAHYIDSSNPDVDLDKLLEESVKPADELFKKYSFEKSAKELYKILTDLQF